MSNPRYTSRPSEAADDDALAQLALDVRWSWNHSADKLWQQLDPELWDLTHNPWVVLQTVSRQRLERVTSDTAFLGMLEELTQAKRTDSEVPRWFQQTHPNSPLKIVAYFSMEYMLSEALPIYSGGLGNVAGDQLKAANDLGVPVIGVGLLYQQGYFRQQIDRNGVQQALFPYNDPGQLPIKPLRDSNGDWVRLPLSLPGFKLWVRTWEAQVGRTKLYLLDTNDPANLPEYRGITSELYGGGPELRLRQEQVLGIGGWRLLRALGIQPEVCHLNEGHAAFAVIERARSYMEETGHPFPLALTITRAGNLSVTSNGSLETADGGLVQGYEAVNGVLSPNQALGAVSIPGGLISPRVMPSKWITTSFVGNCSLISKRRGTNAAHRIRVTLGKLSCGGWRAPMPTECNAESV